MELLATIPEAYEALRIGRTKLYELITNGEIEVVQIGKSVRVTRKSLEKFVRSKARQARHENRMAIRPAGTK